MMRSFINSFKNLPRAIYPFLITSRQFGKFADPTYDSTFKMLFANSKNTDILISLINSLLDFKGDKEVKQVKLMQETFVSSSASYIATLIDVRCQTNSGEEIIVEMQRYAKSYFLSRAQFHMAKAISAHIQDGEAKRHHEIMPKTYVLAISKEGLFTRKYSLDNEDIYETTVVPKMLELGIEVPENKMYWKFYELNKFMRLFKEGKISSETAVRLSIKDQWLHFLHECSKQEFVPENIDDAVKKAYKIMEQSNWTRENQIALEMALLTEQQELEELDLKFMQGKARGIMEGKAEGIIEGKAEGIIEGKAQGIIEGKAEGIIEGKAKGIMEGEIKKQIEIASNLLQISGMEIGDISRITKISLENLQKISDNKSAEVLDDLLKFENINNQDINCAGENPDTSDHI